MVVPLGCIGFVEKEGGSGLSCADSLCLSSKILVATPCVFERRLAAVWIMAVVELPQTPNDRFMEHPAGM
jgi:hypothetical protein